MAIRLILLLACSAAISAACGSGRPDDPLVNQLSSLVPQQREISDQIGGPWDLEEVRSGTGDWGNQAVAEAQNESVDELRNTGRVDGYQVLYRGGPTPNYPLVSAAVTLNAYENEDSAQKVFQRGPVWAAGPSSDSYDFGDAALAWPMSSVSHDSVNPLAVCPCEVWVRVGRLVATVDVQLGGPPTFSSVVSPDALALARIMVRRMAEAQT